MVNVSDLIGQPDDLPFKRKRQSVHLMIYDSVPDLLGKIHTGAIFFQNIHCPKALLIVAESLRTDPVEGSLSCMPEGCMSKIMAQRNGFRQVLVQTQRFRNGPCVLSAASPFSPQSW